MQIPQKLVYEKFYVHKIAAADLSKIYFLKNAKKTCKPNNRDLNRDWISDFLPWLLFAMKSSENIWFSDDFRVNRNQLIRLTLFRMGFFGAAHGWGRNKKAPPSLKSVTHAYPPMMKLGTVIPYPKKIQKYISHVTHPLNSADISIFSLEIIKFCYIKKYRYRLYFDKTFLLI